MKGKILLTIAGLLLVGSIGGAVLCPDILAGTALAQGPDQVYDLSWWTVDGGGGGSGGGDYQLEGTAGQPDPGPILSGGNYQVEGGFWGGGLSGVTVFNTYLPLVLRGYP